MEERYLRNLGALTRDECDLLGTRRVLVAGCGGLGGYLVEQLLRLGVGAITAADGDVFEASNLNRQLLSDVDGIGRSKAAAAAARARAVNPGVSFRAVPAFVTEENAPALIAGCDAVLDALDGIPARRLLCRACSDAGIPYIYGAISGWTAQAAILLPGSGLMDVLYPRGVALGDGGAPAFTPALCASMQTALCVRLLCGRPVEAEKLYVFDLLSMELESLF